MVRPSLYFLISTVCIGTSVRAQPAVTPGKDISNVLLRQFESCDLIGLGELHGSRSDQEIRLELIRQKDFARNVGIVVVEGLNSLFQAELDRYISGAEVPTERIQRVWRDSTQVFADPVMLTASAQLLSDVRSLNLSARTGPKIRVIAADPPIDWTQVQSREEFLPFLRNRVDFGADVIGREVLRKQKKALLIFGVGQLTRNQQMKTPQGFVALTPTVSWLIDKTFPGRLYVVAPIRGAEYPSSRKLEGLIAETKLPVLLRLRGTSFAALEPNEFIPAHSSLLLGAPAPPFPAFRDGVGIAEVADACIYRGRSPDRMVEPDAIYTSDKAFVAEIERRTRIAMPPRR